MKKNLLIKSVLVAIVFCLSIVARTASANMGNLNFYAGAGLDYIKYSAKYVNSNGWGILVPVLGIKFCDHFGVEAGYSFNKKLRTKNRSFRVNNANLKVNNAYLDVIGFIPILDWVDVIAGVGIGRLMVKKGANIASALEIKNRFNWRAKLGTQCNVNDNFGIRALLTYQNVGNKIKYRTKEKKFVKDMTSLGLYAIWTF